MFGLFGGGRKVKDLTVADVAAGMRNGEILLVDVREPSELAAESIPGAVAMPLSRFDPKAIEVPEGKRVVFSCRSGRRSVDASQIAQMQGLAYNEHMAGGILAWKAAGYPTRRG